MTVLAAFRTGWWYNAAAGLEATGYSRWFERLLAELGIEGVDRRCRGDQDHASKEAKDRPRGRPTLAEVAAGKSFRADTFYV
jgi:hypothetical protein